MGIRKMSDRDLSSGDRKLSIETYRDRKLSDRDLSYRDQTLSDS